MIAVRITLCTRSMTMPFTSFSSKRIYIFHFWTSTLLRQNRQFGWKFSFPSFFFLFSMQLLNVHIITAGGLNRFIFISFSKLCFFAKNNVKKREFLTLEFKSNFLLFFFFSSLAHFQTAKKRSIHVFRTPRPDVIPSATASPMWVVSGRTWSNYHFPMKWLFLSQIQLCFG